MAARQSRDDIVQSQSLPPVTMAVPVLEERRTSPHNISTPKNQRITLLLFTVKCNVCVNCLKIHRTIIVAIAPNMKHMMYFYLNVIADTNIKNYHETIFWIDSIGMMPCIKL